MRVDWAGRVLGPFGGGGFHFDGDGESDDTVDSALGERSWGGEEPGVGEVEEIGPPKKEGGLEES